MRDSAKRKNGMMSGEFLMNEGRMRFESSEMKVYQDAGGVFTVIPGTRTVYIGSPIPRGQTSQKFRELQLIRDTLLAASSVTSCATDPRTGLQQIQLRPGNRHRSMYRFDSMIFWIEPGPRPIVRRIRIEYAAGVEISAVEYRFNHIEYRRAPSDFDEPAERSVFDVNGRLLSRFSQYRVVDNRANRPR